MQIKKLDDNLFEKRAANQRKNAKDIIAQCVKTGEGFYEIVDDESVFTSKDRMIEYLDSSARCVNWENPQIKASVRTKNRKQQVIVVVEKVEK